MNSGMYKLWDGRGGGVAFSRLSNFNEKRLYTLHAVHNVFTALQRQKAVAANFFK